MSQDLLNFFAPLFAFHGFSERKRTCENEKPKGSVDRRCQDQNMQAHRYSFKKYLFFSLLVFWSYLNASSQDYFQQEVNYRINVVLNDSRHELNGFESVEYINNSPDTLAFLYFHLWPNAYSNNKTELAKEIFRTEGKKKLFNDQSLRGFIDSINFETDGRQVQWDLIPGSPDICRIILNKPINPGDTITISTPFRVKIPEGVTSRLGHTGQSYQISQWYPKPAVYDRTGWHEMPYIDQGEFFSEYGNFDVTITLPANYVVGATGNLQNEEEKQFLDSLSKDMSWLNRPDFGGGVFPPSSKLSKTLHYTENQIHDFAWFADKRFFVLKGKVILPESRREVTTWAMFTNSEALLWLNSIYFINEAISHFSEWCGDYPYESFTAVQSALSSGAGMEYPGLTVIGLAKDSYLLDEVIAHEICHNWFYSALGSNERRYPYLDESLAIAYESRYMHEMYPEKKLWEINMRNERIARFFGIQDLPVQRAQEIEWLIPARENTEQPLNLASTEYSYDNYGSMVYFKGGQGFNYLRAWLGDSIFDSIMHDYYRTWKFKHPYPEDLRKIFESNTSKDVSWFFDDFIGTTKRLDYKIVRFDGDSVLIKNIGELNSPFIIAGLNKGSVVSEKWEDGFQGKKWIKTDLGNIQELRIDPRHEMTELYRLNNNIATSGLFRKADPFQLRLLFTIEDTEKRTLLYTPVFDWNSSDGFMAGVALLNSVLLPKPIEYFFIPLYTFRNNNLAGYGKIALNIIPYNSPVSKVKLTLEGEKFGAVGDRDYRKIKIGMDILFRTERIINPINKRVFGFYTTASELSDLLEFNESRMLSFAKFGYELKRSGIVNPFNILFSLEAGRTYQKTAAEMNYKFSYYGKNNGLDIRLFAGSMLKNDPLKPYYAFSAGGRSGRELYLYDGLFPDRFGEFPTTLWSRQMDLSEGGIVTPVNDTLGFSRWICSLTLSSSLPGKTSRIPVKPFVNLSLGDPGAESADKTQLFFEAGLKAGIWNFFEIYIPLLVSENIKSVTGNFKERMRFVFKLDLLNPQNQK
jgi:hypothetical protein